jgi:hypothetical protein
MGEGWCRGVGGVMGGWVGVMKAHRIAGCGPRALGGGEDLCGVLVQHLHTQHTVKNYRVVVFLRGQGDGELGQQLSSCNTEFVRAAPAAWLPVDS